MPRSQPLWQESAERWARELAEGKFASRAALAMPEGVTMTHVLGRLDSPGQELR
jgi:hypothetical protein